MAQLSLFSKVVNEQKPVISQKETDHRLKFCFFCNRNEKETTLIQGEKYSCLMCSDCKQKYEPKAYCLICQTTIDVNFVQKENAYYCKACEDLYC